MTDRTKKIRNSLVGVALVGIVVTLTMWWRAFNASFKEGIIFDSIDMPLDKITQE